VELRFAETASDAARAALGYAEPADALFDPRGRTVRCTPRRRTVEGPVVAGLALYRKFREGPGAEEEWRWLHELAEMGFRVPSPVCLASGGGRSVLVCEQVAGRPLDAVLTDAIRTGRVDAELDYCAEHVAPMVRRLHDLGLFHRDLYCNHLFVADLASQPAMIDVERVVRPRWRRRRWQVKDLGALLSSAPAGIPAKASLRFLRAYLDGDVGSSRPLVEAIVAKAARIARHQPKYG